MKHVHIQKDLSSVVWEDMEIKGFVVDVIFLKLKDFLFIYCLKKIHLSRTDVG